jgi:GTP-binding protein
VDLGQDISVKESANEIRKLELELEKFSNELSEKERWMIFNKTDLISDWEKKSQLILDELKWKGQTHQISAATGDGLDTLVKDVMIRLQEMEEERA